MDFDKIIEKHYTKGSDAYNLLTTHSRQVAELALQLADESAVAVDRDFVVEASMLHDIGICRTNAPGIFCFGTEPYLRHGLIGKAMLLEEGLPRHALVCERHIGAGLTANEIVAQKLPLPAVDMLPLTVEEKLVCYADNFFSKSHIAPARTYKQVRAMMARYGEGTLSRLSEMHTLFSPHS
ncbi:MAG: HD domain-containing protein [Bacteroidales bacterium]|nr:HD domain-containing protein [Bacteroidales bacterium]